MLDEADRMLDLGFIRDIRRIVAALPAERQSALFSATMPPEVGEAGGNLAARSGAGRCRPRARRRRCRSSSTCTSSSQPASGRCWAACWRIPALSRVIVFTRTKRGANRVAEALDTGGVRVSALHGNKSQPARQKALEQFRSGRARVLVATDIAARGIDVTGISHVINFDLPAQPERLRAPHRPHRACRRERRGDIVLRCGASTAHCAPSSA